MCGLWLYNKFVISGHQKIAYKLYTSLVIQEEKQSDKTETLHNETVLQQNTCQFLLKIESELILQTSLGSVFHKIVAEGKNEFWNKVVWAKIWESVAEFADLILDRYGDSLLAAGESGKTA